MTVDMSVLLPAEIINTIVEFISPLSGTKYILDRRLKSLALVSSTWTHNSYLLHALENRSDLRSMTKTATLVDFYREDGCKIPEILSHLTHVQELSVWDYSPNGVPPSSRLYQDLTYVVSLPSVRRVTLYSSLFNPLSGRLRLPFSCNRSIEVLLAGVRHMTPEQCNAANALLASIGTQTLVLRPNRLTCCGFTDANAMSTFLSQLNSPSCGIDIRGVRDLCIEHVNSSRSLQDLLYTIGESLETLQFNVKTSYKYLHDMNALDRENPYFYNLSQNPNLRVFDIFPYGGDIHTNSIRSFTRTLNTLPANYLLKKLVLRMPFCRERGSIGEWEMIKRDLPSWVALRGAIMRLDANVEVELTITHPYSEKHEYIDMLERELEPLKGRLRLRYKHGEIRS
ncbi:hypothetical protein BDQ12DRAFT_723172 [Crucibulum laeve]|uniref:Uncharacterized protein n=1 Tax=Crucibulum laeve TaxID=68775 RepID=A0A5C3M286_9AGAR|nr:hypothetical protein BDQ12DRAFT_723172 [Crucibulum laeve]